MASTAFVQNHTLPPRALLNLPKTLYFGTDCSVGFVDENATCVLLNKEPNEVNWRSCPFSAGPWVEVDLLSL